MRRHPIAGPVPRPVVSVRKVPGPTRCFFSVEKKQQNSHRCGVYPPFLDHVPSFSPGHHGFSTLDLSVPHGLTVFLSHLQESERPMAISSGQTWCFKKPIWKYTGERPIFILDGFSPQFYKWKSHMLDFHLQFFRPKWYRNLTTTI
jgi:hypothetical protein